MAHAPLASSVTLLQRPRGRWGRDRPPPAAETPCSTVLWLEAGTPPRPAARRASRSEALLLARLRSLADAAAPPASMTALQLFQGTDQFLEVILETQLHPLTCAMLRGEALPRIQALCCFAAGWLDSGAVGLGKDARRPLVALVHGAIERQRLFDGATPPLHSLALVYWSGDYVVECVGILLRSGAEMTEKDGDGARQDLVEASLLRSLKEARLHRLARALAYYALKEASRNVEIFSRGRLLESRHVDAIAQFLAHQVPPPLDAAM